MIPTKEQEEFLAEFEAKYSTGTWDDVSSEDLRKCQQIVEQLDRI